MTFKSKLVATLIISGLVGPSSISAAAPDLLSPTTSPKQVCDITDPSKPKGCSTINIVSLIATEIKKYYAFSQWTEPTHRFLTEFDGCVVRPLQISWQQYFGEDLEPLDYVNNLTNLNRKYHAEYLTEVAKSQLRWIKVVEERRIKFNFDDYKKCVEIEAERLSYGPFEAYIYKREWNPEYYEVFEKYYSASRENSKTKAIPQTELFKQFLPELISVWETAGKKRVNDHFEIFKMIKLYSEIALIVAEQEKRNIAAEEKAAADQAQATEKKKQLAAEQANAQARAKVLASGGCINKATGGAIANGQKSFGNTCVNGRLIADKPAVSTSKSGSCQDPTSGMLVKNGASIKYSDGTRTCVNGKWSNPVKSGGSTGGKTLVSKTCTISTTGLSSDWYGIQYSWTIYNNWSDGSRTVATMGSGHLNSVPYGC